MGDALFPQNYRFAHVPAPPTKDLYTGHIVFPCQQKRETLSGFADFMECGKEHEDMDDIGMVGFALGGRPEFMGSGGSDGGKERRDKLKEFETAVNSFLEKVGIEKLSEEKLAELLFYITEKQIDTWSELLDFFFNEAAALFLEAMEAVNGSAGDPTSVTQA